MAAVRQSDPKPASGFEAPRSRAKTSHGSRTLAQAATSPQHRDLLRPSTNHGARRTEEKATGTESHECPMNNPDLPPVGEVEHLVERCYCFLCNCGKHVCPGASRRKTEFLRSMYATNYRIEYYRKHGDPSKPLTRTSYSTNRLPMDLQTVKQRDFQPYKIEPTGDFKPKPSTHSVQFVSRSSYQANFPDWGPNEVIRVNRPWLPYRGDQVKIDPKTTYSESFRRFGGSPRDGQTGAPEGFGDSGGHGASGAMNASGGGDTGDYGGSGGHGGSGYPHGDGASVYNPNRNLQKTGGPLGTGQEFYGQTTSTRTFRPFDPRQMASKEGRPNENFVSMESPNRHFKTIYRTDYIPKEVRIRPMKSRSQAAL